MLGGGWEAFFVSLSLLVYGGLADKPERFARLLGQSRTLRTKCCVS
jgi:hypothetical protein